MNNLLLDKAIKDFFNIGEVIKSSLKNPNEIHRQEILKELLKFIDYKIIQYQNNKE